MILTVLLCVVALVNTWLLLRLRRVVIDAACLVWLHNELALLTKYFANDTKMLMLVNRISATVDPNAYCEDVDEFYTRIKRLDSQAAVRLSPAPKSDE